MATFVRVFVIVLILLPTGAVARAEQPLDWLPATGSKGPKTTITTEKGLGTARAEIHAIVTEDAIRENCAAFGSPDPARIRECVEATLQNGTYSKPYVAKADCPARRISTSWGATYQLVGYDPDRTGVENALWRSDAGEILDGNSASNAAGVTGQFAVLCLSGYRSKVEALAQKISSSENQADRRQGKENSLPKTGKQVANLPKAFRGMWGQPKACIASRTGTISDHLAFKVGRKSFGDFGISCELKQARQPSSREIVALAQCSEEGGLDDGDDGQRLVTMTLKSGKLVARFQHVRINPDVAMEFQDYKMTLPRCR
ncbi:hypothetical protein [Ochrobactrum sp. SFR4]|uniref:hypothetical protein n=1 Tax=Ochrobactrum sp. SFR4 TaxID=2717368 RepID=UPI001C8B6BF0|nr:hypothetical protein [Ochrobactrum sp. SFR4]MBX8826269.1 hypothetical protein [Ochrobactrum sp. SFR4]